MDNSTPTHNIDSRRSAPKRHHGLAITFTIIAILIVAGIAVTLLPKSHHSSASNDASGTTAATTPKTAKAVITALAADHDLQTAFPNATFSVATATTAPNYRYNNANFYTSGNFGYVLKTANISSSDQGAQNQLAARAKADFLNDGLTATATANTYQNATIVCDTSTLSCADKSDYAERYNAQRPLAAAFYQANPSDNANLILVGMPDITKESGGYSNAAETVNFTDQSTNSIALFYAQNGNWQYFQSTQDGLPCTKYNTLALQTAFDGMTCFINTPQPDTESEVMITQ